METRLSSTHGSGRLLLASIVALAVVMALGATSVSAASPTACRVQNTHTRTTYKALQAAVDAARKGDRLTVRGTCRGGTLIGTQLVIEGVRTTTSGKPTLSGAGKSRVVTITKGVRVRMRSIEIVRGSGPVRGSTPSGRGGGGILNQGTLTLVEVVVRGNRAHYPFGGGGIRNAGTLTLTGSTRVHHNRAPGAAGGGVSNGGILVMNDSSAIYHNRGGATNHAGTVTMNDFSSIHHNRDSGVGYGYGIGTLTMNDSSTIHHNKSFGVADMGTLTMNDSSAIHSNGDGGVNNSGTMTMNGSSSISSNRGYGVFNNRTMTMNDSSAIYGNGNGGVVNNFTLTMNDSSSIHDNHADEGVGGPGKGGGVFVYHGATLTGVICGPAEGANVYGNTPDDCYFEP